MLCLHLHLILTLPPVIKIPAQKSSLANSPTIETANTNSATEAEI